MRRAGAHDEVRDAAAKDGVRNISEMLQHHSPSVAQSNFYRQIKNTCIKGYTALFFTCFSVVDNNADDRRVREVLSLTVMQSHSSNSSMN